MIAASRRLIPIAAIAVLLIAVPSTDRPARATVLGSTTMIRPHDMNVGSPAAEISAARNEFASFQVKIDAGESRLKGVDVGLARPLTLPGGDAKIPPANVTFFREAYYTVARPSDGELWTSDPCPSNCLIPDALIPKVDEFFHATRDAFTHRASAGTSAFSLDIPAAQNRVAWVDVLVPKAQPSGTYRGSVRVTGTADGGGTFSQDVPVTLTVRDFGLPSTSSLQGAYGTQWRNICPADDGCAGTSGWALYAKYATLALEDRITLSRPGYGAPSDDTEKFRKYAEPLLDGTSAARLPGARMTDVVLGTDEAAHMAAWKADGARGGFLDRITFYCDELSRDHALWASACDAPYARASRNWNASAPDVATLPVANTGSAADLQWAKDQGDLPVSSAITTLVALVNDLNPMGQRFPATAPDYGAFVAHHPGRRFWIYQSCRSSGCQGTGDDVYSPGSDVTGWPSYAIDQPASEARAMPWIAYAYGATGEYYYETVANLGTAWGTCSADDEGSDGPKGCQYYAGANGDGTLFYPGTQATIGGPRHEDVPVESIRLKRIRDGRQDYEYLKLATDAGKGAQAKAIALGLFPNAYSTNQTQQAIDRARDRLANLIA